MEFIDTLGFPGGSEGKESACNTVEVGWIPGSGRFLKRREWLPTTLFLPGEFHGQRSLVGHSPWSHKELDMTEQLTHTYTSQIDYWLQESKGHTIVTCVSPASRISQESEE